MRVFRILRVQYIARQHKVTMFCLMIRQVFEFLTLTFKMYYEWRLLTVTFNRMDRYISLWYKGHQNSIIIISLSKMEVTFFTMYNVKDMMPSVSQIVKNGPVRAP